MSILKTTRIIAKELIETIESAQTEILLQTFYINNDTIFSEIAEKLIEKSLYGVHVYCLFDALGAKSIMGTVIEKRLQDSGVRVEYFNWLTPWKNRNKKLWYFRNHKRSLIVDKKKMHIGGWCFGDKAQDWIDCNISSINLETIEAATIDFWNMYKYAYGPRLRFPQQKRYTYNGTDFSNYTYQAPLFRARYIYYTHKKMIEKCEKRIIITTPYFAPIHNLLRVVKKARMRGVEVEIYLPKKTDHTLVDIVGRTYMHNLLKIGVRVFFSDTMIHAKTCLFDNILYVGTMNLDTISLRYNFENGLYLNYEDTIQSFEQDILSLRAQTKEITLTDWENRTFFERALDKIMKLFRPFV